MTEVQVRSYQGLAELSSIRDLVEETLSEPYSVFTYHYFLQEYPQLTFTVILPLLKHAPRPPCSLAILLFIYMYIQAWHGERLVGVAMGRVNMHRGARRGYIGMLSVSPAFRGQGIGRGSAGARWIAPNRNHTGNRLAERLVRALISVEVVDEVRRCQINEG